MATDEAWRAIAGWDPEAPDLASLEAIADDHVRAHVIVLLGVRDRCARSRALILSIADEGWFGTIAQSNLREHFPDIPEPQRLSFKQEQFLANLKKARRDKEAERRWHWQLRKSGLALFPLCDGTGDE